MKKTASLALEFLASRNPFAEDQIQRIQWVMMLMDFTDIHGEDALIGLAGFYIYAIKEIKGDKGSNAIKSTFAHDVIGRKDRHMLPRSIAFGEYFTKEYNLAA